MTLYPLRLVLEYLGADLQEYPGKIKCPFHSDEVASATWDEYHFKCFACEAKGDAVKLLHDYGGLDWSEAYSKAEELAGEAHTAVRSKPRSGSGVSGGPRFLRGNRPRTPFGSR